jgi:hypothetical protein
LPVEVGEATAAYRKRVVPPVAVIAILIRQQSTRRRLTSPPSLLSRGCRNANLLSPGIGPDA